MRAALLALLLSAPAAAAGPKLRPERLVLRTTAGDVVLGFYEGEAPKTASRVLEMARLGVYDGARIASVSPGLYAQVGEAFQRAAPLTPGQAAAVSALPFEPSGLRHRRGFVALNGRSAFSIMLGDWPRGDGRFTVFGRVLEGLGVVDTLSQAPADAERRPLAEMDVYKAQVMTAAEVRRAYLAPPHLLIAPVPQPRPASPAPSYPEAAAAFFVLLTALAAYACARVYPRAASPLTLLSVLSCMFLVLMLAGPAGQAHPLLGAGLFLSLLGTLRLMSAFESRA